MRPPRDPAVAAVRDCARALLVPDGADGPPWSPPTDLPLSAFWGAVARHRLWPLLVRRREALDVGLHPRVTQAGAELRRAGLLQVHELRRALDTLRSSGVPALAIKGPALAVQTTGDLMARGPGDLDLWIDPADVAGAHTALRSAGWLPDAGYPTPGESWAWRHLLGSLYELPFRSPASDVDLHWQLDPSTSALPGFATAWEEHVEVDLAGTLVPTMGRRHAFRHSAAHAARDDWRWLRSLVDIYLLAGADELWTSLDPAGLRRVELTSLAVVHACLGLPEAVPATLRARLDQRTWAGAVGVARRAQERPAFPEGLARVPGAYWLLHLRRSLRGASTPTDVRRVLGSLVLSPAHLAEVSATSPAAAIPRAALARVRHAVDIAREGRSWP